MDDNVSFNSVDELTAESQYNSWIAEKCETLDEFILRKRRIELNALVRKVIENELCENDRNIIRLHWYEGKNFSQAAEEMGIDKSTVTRRIDRITEIVYDKLKYALEYRYGKDYSENIGVIVKNRDAVFCVINPVDTASRIKNLRIRQGMTLKDVCEMTNIAETELEKIEKAEKEPNSTHIAKIAKAFRTTADYLVFGK